MGRKKGIPAILKDEKGRDILDREKDPRGKPLWRKGEEEGGHRRYRNRTRARTESDLPRERTEDPDNN